MVASLADVVSLLDATSVLLFAVTLVVFAIPVFIIFPPLPVERSDALGQTHSKIGVPPQESRLRDQWTMPPFSANGQAKAQQPANGRSGEPPAAESGAQRPRIHSLHIYPLKSCSGIELSEASVVPKGMEHDRVFCLAQRKTKRVAAGDAAAAAAATNAAEKGNVEYWDVVTLRQIALMANIKVDLWIPDATKHSRQLGPMAAAANNGEDGGSDEGSNGFLVVRFPWRDAGLKGLVQTIAAKLSRGLSASVEREFMLPMSFPDARDIEARGYSYGEVTLFRNAISALNMSPELPPELARYLGLEPDKLALFRMDPARRRQVLRCAPTRDVAGYEPQVDFQDAYPLHLLNLSSVRALESIIRRDAEIERLDARRFRPNIIVSGLPEYDEDDWRAIQFKAINGQDQDSQFDVSCRTVRCKLPNVDPATGLRHKVEPDYALRHYREIDTGAPKKGCMGMQMCPLFSPNASGVPEKLQSTLRVGMEIAVLKRGTHHAL